MGFCILRFMFDVQTERPGMRPAAYAKVHSDTYNISVHVYIYI